MIPKNKRHLIVNKEYSRLPYWTDDQYQDVQLSTSQKYMQDTYGAFPESEMQQPYKGDPEDDYQALEYDYSTPQFPDNNSDVLQNDTVPAPGAFCVNMWNKIFAGNVASLWDKIKKYIATGCPMNQAWHYCCTENLKINGPSEVEVGQTVSFSVSGGNNDCDYNLDADGGMMIAGSYTAPSTPGKDTIFVSPFTGSDARAICPVKKDIKITAPSCPGKISGLSQMAAGALQWLKVSNPGTGVYTWSTTSGTLGTPVGNQVLFTAPATNANCANNPTISLICGGGVVDTLTIAVNAFSASNVGEICVLSSTSCDIETYPNNSYPYNRYYYGTAIGHKDGINCDGIESEVIAENRVIELKNATGSCTTAIEAALRQLKNWLHLDCHGASFDTWNDLRTPTQKAAGCCPYQLL